MKAEKLKAILKEPGNNPTTNSESETEHPSQSSKNPTNSSAPPKVKRKSR